MIFISPLIYMHVFGLDNNKGRAFLKLKFLSTPLMLFPKCSGCL